MISFLEEPQSIVRNCEGLGVLAFTLTAKLATGSWVLMGNMRPPGPEAEAFILPLQHV